MQRSERTQADDEQEYYSELSGLDCSNLPDMARQEFKDEADTNKLLARYGVGVPQKPVTFSEAAFNMDLQQALEALNTARTAYHQMSPEIRQAYPTWRRLLDALQSGKVVFDMPKTVPPAPEPKPPIAEAK